MSEVVPVNALARATATALSEGGWPEQSARVLADPTMVDRQRNPRHVTASVFVCDAKLEHVLLVHHAKAGVWAQPGGHLEPSIDADPRSAARRELAEETGITEAQLSHLPVELTSFIGAQVFGGCTEHLDLTYAATATPTHALEVSSESIAVQWFSLAEYPKHLPATLSADLRPRLHPDHLVTLFR